MTSAVQAQTIHELFKLVEEPVSWTLQPIEQVRPEP